MASARLATARRPSKDEYYLGIALAVSRRSTCLRRAYGAVLVNNDEIVATGYNGAARGRRDCLELGVCARDGHVHNDGDYGSCPAVHAEMNALLSASRSETIGATLYLAGMDVPTGERIAPGEVEPCPVCSRMILNAGVARVVTGA